jgi:cobalt-zinc-cadmium efflux system outer membrane protein
MNRFPANYLLVALALLLGGCATVSKDEAFEDINQDLEQRLGERVHWKQGRPEDEQVAQRVSDLLAGEISVAQSVQVALLNNPMLQARFEDLGIAQANLVQAGLLNNPVFHGEIRWPREDEGRNYDLGVSLDFLRILTIPLRRKVAEAGFESAKLEVSAAVLDLSAQVRKTFYQAQAATQSVEMMQQVVQSTGAAVHAAERLHAAGNIPDLRLANQRALHEEARLFLAAAEGVVLAGRERLNVLMGLWGRDTQWRLAARLPEPPGSDPDLTQIERRAVNSSLELASARLKLQSLAQQLGLDKNTRLLPEFELGYAFERDDGEKEDGISLGLQIPLFDYGQARVARGQARLRRAQQEYLSTAIQVRSAARLTRESVRLAHARVNHVRKVMLPLSQQIVDESLLSYNAMQIGVFRLLQAQERQIALGQRYIELLRDYWIARADLDLMLSGRMPDGGGMLASATSGDAPMASGNSGGH